MAKSENDDPWEYSLRKYLLLLATLVATVTYSAGFNPPGGVWQNTDNKAHQLAGDPIIRDTSSSRYLAFFYCNATAFASSLVVIVLLLILSVLHEKRDLPSRTPLPLRTLRVVMAMDLLSLMGAYAAGTCRDVLTTAYSSTLAGIVVAYVAVNMVIASCSNKDNTDLERVRKVLMLLATFAVSVTYLAGLSAPGGFWDHVEGRGRPGHAVLRGSGHDRRLKAFFVCNTTAFATSLLIIVLLLDKKLSESSKLRKWELYGFILVTLAGLMGAYSAGSCRQVDTTVYVNALIGAVLIVIFIQVVSVHYFGSAIRDSSMWRGLGNMRHSVSNWWRDTRPSCLGGQTDGSQPSNGNGSDGRIQALQKARSLVLLLATLAAAITYQAGLDPPGGLWEADGDVYMAGDPILLTRNPKRYKAFFYCNSVAFVASLVAIVLVRMQSLHRHNALEAAMILDLFGLIGAYAAGSCRDVRTSVNAMALAGAVLVYVMIHIVFFTLDHDDIETRAHDAAFLSRLKKEHSLLEKRRKRMLLFAILAATITYQAGLTPPSGFRIEDDKSGHHAGDPVLLYNSELRYKAFFYCNSVSFMLSIALIILLVNKNLYRPAIRSNALSICTAAGMFGLVGAYAAGSTQHIKTSIYIFALAGVILAFVGGLVIVLLVIHNKEKKQEGARAEQSSTETTTDVENAHAGAKPSSIETTTEEVDAHDENARSNVFSQGNTDMESVPRDGAGTAESSASRTTETDDAEKKQKKIHAKRKYLMLLGILVASVTYQAGLEPPGGVWDSNGKGHAAGNPIMHDNRHPRYLAFFYSNSTSFVASIVVIILLLPEQRLEQPRWWAWWLAVMNMTIVLDLLGLLIAYAAGSSRSWKTSAYVTALVIAVLGYFVIHVVLSCFNRYCNSPRSPVASTSQLNGDGQEDVEAIV